MITEGQVVLFTFPQTSLLPGKLRPALVLRAAPGPFDDWLVCMISSQLQQELPHFDERIGPDDADFPASGLKRPSLIRASRLAVVYNSVFEGSIGRVAEDRLSRVQSRVAEWLNCGSSVGAALDLAREPSDSVGRLMDFGFQLVGRWRLDEALKSEVRVELSALHGERAIYAFAVGDVVRYVGVCDSSGTTLKDRMSRYQAMQGAGTNERVVEEIRECLSRGEEVTVHAWVPEGPVRYVGLDVDLVKGLEGPLIHAVQPQWNIRQ